MIVARCASAFRPTSSSLPGRWVAPPAGCSSTAGDMSGGGTGRVSGYSGDRVQHEAGAALERFPCAEERTGSCRTFLYDVMCGNPIVF